MTISKTTQNPSFNESKCKFCGAERKEIEMLGSKLGFFEACVCPDAQKELLEIQRKSDERKAQEEADKRAQLAQGLFKRAGLGKRFESCSFLNYRPKTPTQEKALVAARNFCEDFLKDRFCRGLIISGDCGTGKTHLASAIISELTLKHRIDCLFGTPVSLFSEIKRSYEDGSKESEIEAVHRISSVPLLIIDDFGKENSKRDSSGWSWSHQMLYEIINRRYMEMLPVIITTNLSSKEILEKTDSAILDRFKEMCAPVMIKGQSERKF